MSLRSTIRLYEILPDGKFHALLITDLSHYAGTCPNVGDVIVHQFGQDDADIYFNVQRRVFIGDSWTESGWIILLNRIDPTPLIRGAHREWIDETEFWIEVDRKEAEKKSRDVAKRLRNQLRRPKKKTVRSAAAQDVKQGQAKPKSPPDAERGQVEPLDQGNRDPKYWTSARKKQLKKERLARLAQTGSQLKFEERDN